MPSADAGTIPNRSHAERIRRRRCDEACITCKRRKERCDGVKPCGRCFERGVEEACVFGTRGTLSKSRRQSHDDQRHRVAEDIQSHPVAFSDRSVHNGANFLTLINSNTSTTSVLDTSRLILDIKGKYMFIGDSANLSMLQHIRNLVRASVGICPFVEDPLRYQMVEAVPNGSASWLHATEQRFPQKPNLQDATHLIRWFCFATNCVLDLFDEKDLLDNLAGWLDSPSDGGHHLSALYYLVFAIGAQTCPGDKDSLASHYFDYGRYLTASYFTEDPSITTVQAYAMITMYMLCASRRNAAFMYLGTAVRAAYALGLHRSDISGHFGPIENQTRERLWKVMRILDLFMSASLGRPPATAETRDTELKESYSASNDLCAIFEKILTDVYAQRMVSTESLEQISRHHRRWTARFREGLATDRIADKAQMEDQRPNIGLLHVKEAYYWTVILLARPFFMESISSHIASKLQTRSDGQQTPDLSKSSHQILVHACVNSAMSTVDLLQMLLGAQDMPKRLPFIVNSLFVAGLVLGLSYFGDWYTTYALDESLHTILELLGLFPNDAIAKRCLTILELLRDACRMYVRQQATRNKKRQRDLVSGMFGQMDSDSIVQGANGSSDPVLVDHTPQANETEVSQPLSLHNQAPDTQSQVTDIDSRDSQVDAGTNAIPGQNPNGSDTLDANFLPAGTQDDYLIAPMMSPRTLWFDSYENNNPFFSTIDTGAFND